MVHPELKKVEIEPELLEQAARLGIDVTGVGERTLRLHLQKVDPAGAEARAKRWAEGHQGDIRIHNAFVAEHGLLSDHFRPWWL